MKGSIISAFFFLMATSFVVAQHDKEFFSVPSAFTPNDDGKNDSLVITGSGLKKYSVKIYNDWGEIMVEMSDEKDNCWKGEYKNVAQPAGVYVWTADVEFESGKTEKKNGSVTLIR